MVCSDVLLSTASQQNSATRVVTRVSGLLSLAASLFLHSDLNFLRAVPCKPLALAWSVQDFEIAHPLSLAGTRCLVGGSLLPSNSLFRYCLAKRLHSFPGSAAALPPRPGVRYLGWQRLRIAVASQADPARRET